MKQSDKDPHIHRVGTGRDVTSAKTNFRMRGGRAPASRWGRCAVLPIQISFAWLSPREPPARLLGMQQQSIDQSAAFQMGTPDALRLSRLDRLINQLGEHQLSIRQQVGAWQNAAEWRPRTPKQSCRPCLPRLLQGTSVTDLDERMKGLESDLQAVLPLRVSGTPPPSGPPSLGRRCCNAGLRIALTVCVADTAGGGCAW